MATPAIRYAIKQCKKKKYNASVAQLNEDGDGGGGVEFLAMCDCEVTNEVGVGITGRPMLIRKAIETIKSMIGKNRRTFVAIRSKASSEVYYLLLHPQEMSDGYDDDAVLENAAFDTGFACDRGVSVLTSSNTSVHRSSEDGDTFVFEPPAGHIKRATFVVHLVDDPQQPCGRENKAAAASYLSSIAV